ncbi:hypothetical protein ACFZB3_48900, partial [Streptomyces sp. NPDC008092]
MASGAVCLVGVRVIAEAGVGLVSVGALTRSAPALDLAVLLATDLVWWRGWWLSACVSGWAGAA